MIQANELRIGNWVYYGESMRTITAIGNSPQRKFIGVDNLITELHIIKPIPLSPEILLKCGFKQVEGDDNIWKEIKISDFDIVWWMSGLYFLTTDGYGGDFQFYHSTDEDSYWCINYHVKHLHQLQNLIFALTENELNIQL